jgi:hypothetical protein
MLVYMPVRVFALESAACTKATAAVML